MTLAITHGNTVTLDFGNLNTDEQNIDALAFDSATTFLDRRHHGRDEPDDLLGGFEHGRANFIGLRFEREQHHDLSDQRWEHGDA